MRRWFARIAVTAIAAVTLLSALPTGIARADGAVIYVHRAASGAATGLSWTDAYPNLQTALDAARPGDEIWVAAGVYTPTNVADRWATFNLKSDVSLYGGFAGTESYRDQRDWTAHVTVLSGDVDGNDATDANGVVTHWSGVTGNNVFHVVTADAVAGDVVLDGFTITGGYADAGGYEFNGGGLANISSSPILRNLTFSGNRASRQGGGLANTAGSPTLINVTFSRNRVVYQWSYGGGMSSSGGAPTLLNVAFYANEADMNNGKGGGMSVESGSAALVNAIFSGNSAEHGGGMYTNQSNVTLINTTLTGNAASPLYGEGGGVYISGSAVLVNSILWGNTSKPSSQQQQIAITVGSGVTLRYSLVQNKDVSLCGISAVTCDHVIGDDPLLTGDLRLGDSSPAIDAGDTRALPADAYDLDGDRAIVEPLPYDLAGDQRRVEHPRADTGAGASPLVDMGAYEKSVLMLDKRTDPVVLEPGDPLTYVITFKNDSPYTLTEASLSDAIPIYLDNLDFASDGAPITPTGSVSYTWAVQDLAAGAGGVITITGQLNALLLPGRSFENVARFSGVADGLTVERTAAAVVARRGADLAVGQHVARDPAVAGAPLTYTLTLTNHGVSPVIGVVLTDTLPGTAVWLAASPGCQQAASHTVTCTLSSLKSQASAAFTVAIAAPPTAGQIVAVVTATAALPDPDLSNNTAAITTLVSAAADLGVTKHGQPDLALAGSWLTYTLVAANHGPDVAGGVTLSDALPAGTSYAGQLLALPLNETAGSAHFADVSGFGHAGACNQRLEACPEAGVRGLYDTVLSFDGVNDWVESADFDIGNDFTLALWVYPLKSGDGQAFIAKHDSGGGDLLVLGFYGGGYSVNLRGTTYQTGTKTADAWQHLAVVGQQTGPATTTITLYKDGHPLWQRDFAAVAGDFAGKGWTLGQEWDGGALSDFFYGALDEVHIYNRPLTAVEIAALQARHPVVAPIINGGTCHLSDSGKLTCALGMLAPGAVITAAFPVQLSAAQAGTLTNTASVSGYVPDLLAGNDAATATAQIGALDLALDKTANAASAAVGDAVVYTLTLANHGPAIADEVIVSDTLPVGLELSGAIAGAGVYSDVTGLWRVGPLAAGGVATLTITSTVEASAAGRMLTNTAAISASIPTDLFTQDNQASVAIAVDNAPLNVRKTVDTGGLAEVELGGVVTYTLILQNASDAITAAGVTLHDPLPPGVTFGAWVTQSSASLTAQTIAWGPHDIAARAAHTLCFTAHITTTRAFAGQSVANTAYVAVPNAPPLQDTAAFTIQGWRFVYLPLVLKD